MYSEQAVKYKIYKREQFYLQKNTPTKNKLKVENENLKNGHCQMPTI